MNLRINPDSFRFRIDINELDQLTQTRRLEASTQLIEGLTLSYIVKLGVLPEQCVRNLLHLDITRTQQGIAVMLTVSPEAQQLLINQPPSKEGLTDFKTLPDGSMLTIGLEVDTKSQRQGAPA